MFPDLYTTLFAVLVLVLAVFFVMAVNPKFDAFMRKISTKYWPATHVALVLTCRAAIMILCYTLACALALLCFCSRMVSKLSEWLLDRFVDLDNSNYKYTARVLEGRRNKR